MAGDEQGTDLGPTAEDILHEASQQPSRLAGMSPVRAVRSVGESVGGGFRGVQERGGAILGGAKELYPKMSDLISDYGESLGSLEDPDQITRYLEQLRSVDGTQLAYVERMRRVVSAGLVGRGYVTRELLEKSEKGLSLVGGKVIGRVGKPVLEGALQVLNGINRIRGALKDKQDLQDGLTSEQREARKRLAVEKRKELNREVHQFLHNGRAGQGRVGLKYVHDVPFIIAGLKVITEDMGDRFGGGFLGAEQSPLE